jgi:diketogulonate reductase-like aldo/keto reductase
MNSLKVPVISLNDGNAIPVLGFGTWQIPDGTECEAAVEAALAAGYRHIDTASDYGNEASVGRAIRRSGIPRRELFVTTKLFPGPDAREVRKEFARSLERLQMDSVDLYLIHWPKDCYREAWGVLEELQREGKCRSIGVSNYTVSRFESDDFFATARVVPAIDQIEVNAFIQRPDLAAYCRRKGIRLEAYRPLAGAKELANEVLQGIAEKTGRSPAQVMLRFLVQKEIIAIPKTVTPSRMRENIAIFDFTLEPADIARLEGLHDARYLSLPLPGPIQKSWY